MIPGHRLVLLAGKIGKEPIVARAAYQPVATVMAMDRRAVEEHRAVLAARRSAIEMGHALGVGLVRARPLGFDCSFIVRVFFAAAGP